MALFGVSSYVSDGVDPVIFEKGDNKISYSNFQATLQQSQRQALSQNLQVDVTSDLFRNNVLRQMINQVVVQDLASGAGYTADDKTVANAILGNSSFQIDGKFDQSTYDRYVAGNYGSKQNYEDLLKNNIALSHFSTGLFDSALSLDSQQQEFFDLMTEKRNIDLFTFKLADYENNAVSYTHLTLPTTPYV